MELRDLDVQRRLTTVIDMACGKRNTALDASLLAEIKALCKLGDNNVLLAWDALWLQLKAQHAQTRLLALLICEQLFARSRAFRQALLARLTQFLEFVIGFRSDRPLPPPSSAAEALRDRGLQLLGAWEHTHGARNKQLALAVRYLRDTLQYRFPEINAAAAAAEAEEQARRERQQQLLHARLVALGSGSSGEWHEGAAAARQLLREVAECFDILEKRHQAQQAQQGVPMQQAEAQQQSQGQGTLTLPAAGGKAAGAAGAAVGAPAAAPDGLQWEDVALPADSDADAAAPAAELQQPLLEGLSAYAAAGPAGEAAAGVGDDSGTGSLEAGSTGGTADLEVVLEMLAGLYRQLTTRTLPQVQDWLQLLGRVEPEGPAQEAQRQQLLRAATVLRGQLAAARNRCVAAGVDLDGLLLRRQRREAQQQQEQQRQPERQQQRRRQRQSQLDGAGNEEDGAVAEAIHELFGESGGSDEEGEGKGSQGSARHQLQARRTQNTAAGPPTTRHQRRIHSAGRQPARAGGGSGGDDDFENPYLRIVDPAAPRPCPQQPPSSRAAGEVPAARAGSEQRRPSSSLPEEVRKRLAEQAPVLPTGLHTLFWDSKSVPTFVSWHGLEVSNHWGPVDVHKELPPERVDELFMLPMPASRQYVQPKAEGKQSQRPQQQQWQQQCQEPSQQLQWPSRQGGTTAAAGVGSRQHPAAGPAHAGRSADSSAATEPLVAQGAPAPAPAQGEAAAAAAAAAEAAAGAAASDRWAAKRARRAEERAYNEAVISGRSDEVLARHLQDGEQAQAAQGDQRQQQQQRQGRQAKKMSVRDRLAQKLLRGRAVAAAVRDVATAESEARREKFGSRW